MSDHKKTIAQDELVAELVATYDLTADQIGFEGEKLDPIFDFDALCAMREKLTNFKAVDVSESLFDSVSGEASAICVIINDQNRTITISDFAQIGEMMPDGSKVAGAIQARRLARARAMRSGIRAAGVNLMKAHRNYLESGEILDFQPVDVRYPQYQEIHVIAAKLGMIGGTDKAEYQQFIAEQFDGRTSAKELDDLELQRLLVTFRALARVKKMAQPKAA